MTRESSAAGMAAPRTYRHPEQPDPAVEHRPIWRWRFAAHTFEAKRAAWGEGRNVWQYIDRMPTHDGYVGIHPDAEAQQVTARMVRDALDEAYLQGELAELDRAREQARRRKAIRNSHNPQPTAGLVHRARRWAWRLDK